MARYYRVGLYKEPNNPVKLKDLKESVKTGDIIVQDNTTYAKEITTKLKFPIYSSNDKVGTKSGYYVKDSDLIDENIVTNKELNDYINKVSNGYNPVGSTNPTSKTYQKTKK